MKNVEIVAYRRNSSPEQTTSQAIQCDVFEIALGEKWLADLLGGKPIVAENYVDDGKSASKKKSKRDDFYRLMHDIKDKHHGKPLLVVNLSRLSRMHPSDVIVLFNTLQQSSTSVISIDDKKIYRSNTLLELLELLLKSNDNHEYARTLAKNTLRGNIKSAMAGTYHCGTPPYGMARKIISNGSETIYARLQKYRKGKDDKSYLVPGDELEISIVRWIYHTFASSDISYGSIVRLLNTHSNPIVRHGPNGKGWNVPTIQHILSNPHYAGYEFFGRRAIGEHYRIGQNGDVVESENGTGPHPIMIKTGMAPIVAKDLQLCTLNKMSRIRQSNSNAKTNAIGDGNCLTGIVYCGHCGGKMYGDKIGGKVAYICRNSYN